MKIKVTSIYVDNQDTALRFQDLGSGGRNGRGDRVSESADCDSRRAQWHCA
jgi:hypothetical protein